MALDDTLRQGFDAFGRGDYATASQCAKAALNEQPGNAGALLLLGRLAYMSQRLDVAMEIFSKLTEQPCPAEIWIDLARVLVALRREEDAAEAARAAMQLDQDLTLPPIMLGNILLSLNDRAGAVEAYRRAIGIDFADSRAYIGLARAAPLGLGAPEVAQMQRLLREPLAKANLAELHYALSIVHKRHGNDKEFIEHVLTANELQRQERPGTRAFYQEVFDTIEQAFSAENLSSVTGAPGYEPAPIFIVGQPRSGTTLVEQIVSQHPDVTAGGELDYLRQVMRPELMAMTGQPFPLGWERLTSAQFTQLAAPFTKVLRLVSRGARRVTDKTPGNFHMLGLIPFLFPNAKIVHVSRDAMDTCFSILQQPFLDRSPHMYDMELLAYSYARYERLVAILQTRMPRRIYTIRYEQLVANPEAEGQRLMRWLGLDWSPAFLDFHKQRAAVHTFSSQQVRRAVHGESVGSWKKFERELAPLRNALIAEGVVGVS